MGGRIGLVGCGIGYTYCKEAEEIIGGKLPILKIGTLPLPKSLLLEFASQRYPDWQDRLEPDLGMMLLEVMSALGDEPAYYQDRIAREAYLESASQRRSLRHLARLVDYEVHNGLAASTWQDVSVKASETAGDLPAGADVWSLGDDGRRVSFEVGRGLRDRIDGRAFHVEENLNSLQP